MEEQGSSDENNLEQRDEVEEPVNQEDQKNHEADNRKRCSVHEQTSGDVAALGGVLRLLERNKAENQANNVHRDDGDGEESGREDEGDRSQVQPVLTPRNQHVHQRPEDDQRKDDKSGDPKSATRCP